VDHLQGYSLGNERMKDFTEDIFTRAGTEVSEGPLGGVLREPVPDRFRD
jgi:hypothetical protein